MTTIGEYIQYRKSINPHLQTNDIDREMRARAMRKTGRKQELSNEKSIRRHSSKSKALKKGKSDFVRYHMSDMQMKHEGIKPDAIRRYKE